MLGTETGKQLCCDSTDVLKSCHWGDCGSGCTSNEEAVAWRLDKDNGGMCTSPLGLWFDHAY